MIYIFINYGKNELKLDFFREFIVIYKYIITNRILKIK